MTMMRDVLALVLAGGSTSGFGVLTLNRAKGALPFGGHYRIVDFALSNLRNSGVHQVGLIIQYLPSSLIEHVGVGHPWDFQGYGRLLKIMPPFVGIKETVWYKGTADALWQNMNIVRDLNPEHIIVLSGEHVYYLDYRAVLAFHRDHDADITMVTKTLPPPRRTSRFGYVLSGDGQRVTAFLEKPSTPPPGATISTGIYVFRTRVLMDLLSDNAATATHNLAKDILEPYASQFKSFNFPSHEPWEYLESAADYYQVHFDLLGCEGGTPMASWGILTNQEYRGLGFAPPPYFGRQAQVDGALVGGGCHIEGTVERSILSPGVRVGPGAVVRDSIVMHDCIIGEGALLDGVISDKDAEFAAGCRVGADRVDLPRDTEAARSYGILTLVGKGARIGPGVSVPKTIQVAPGGRLPDQQSVETEIAALEGRIVATGDLSPYFMRGRA